MTAITLSPPCATILAELRRGPRTTRDLLRATGCLSVHPRITELRRVLGERGVAIDTRLLRVRNRHGATVTVAQYSLRRERKPRATARRAAA